MAERITRTALDALVNSGEGVVVDIATPRPHRNQRHPAPTRLDRLGDTKMRKYCAGD
jgi:hypothetical protein